MTDVIDVAEIARISRSTDARAVATAVYAQMLVLLESLEPGDWQARTDCPDWDVADMVAHLIGAAKGHAAIGELVRQQWWAARHRADFAGNRLDAMNALQVAEHAPLPPTARIAALRGIAPAAVDGRMRLPRLLRRVPIAVDAGGSSAAGLPEGFTLGELVDVILTRDVWLHRIDIARAVGRDLELDAAVDGRVVADLVAEWTARYGADCTVTLTGAAGGRFRQGHGGEHVEMDAIEFARVLSGRAHGEGLLAVRLVF